MATGVSADGYKAAETIRYDAYSTAAALKQAVAVAQFALSAADAVQNFRKLSDISSRGIAIEEQQHAFLRNTYWPKEQQFLAEFSQSQAWESETVLRKRYAGQLRASVMGAFAPKLRELECSRTRYCDMAFTRAYQELLTTRAAALTNADALAGKMAWAEVQAVNDTDFARRQQVVALKQGLLGAATALLQSASGGFAAAGNDALKSASSALEALGYYRNRDAGRDEFHAAVAAGARDAGVRDDVYAGSMLRQWDSAQESPSGGTVVSDDAGIPDYSNDLWGDPSMSADGAVSGTPDHQPTLTNPNNMPDLVRGGKIKITGLKVDTAVGTGVVRPFTIDISKLPVVNASKLDFNSEDTTAGPGPADGEVSYTD